MPGSPYQLQPSELLQSCSFTMIFLTTFILTLFLTQIARALPEACGDPIYLDSESSTLDAQINLQFPSPLDTRRVTFDHVYDNKARSLQSVACSNLFPRFKTFGDLPTFPRIGGAFDITFHSPNCGGCWTLTNKENNRAINITAIDHAAHGFHIAEAAFKRLSGGKLGNALQVDARKVPASFCGL